MEILNFFILWENCRSKQQTLQKALSFSAPNPGMHQILILKLCISCRSLRARTAKTLICTKSGVSADSRKSAKKCAKPHFLRTFYILFAQKVRFAHFVVLFLESAETPLFVQINVFAVRALRLDRKYTILKICDLKRFGAYKMASFVSLSKLRFLSLFVTRMGIRVKHARIARIAPNAKD